MVKSRSSTSSLFRLALHPSSSSIFSHIAPTAEHDAESIITFRPPSAFSDHADHTDKTISGNGSLSASSASKNHRPPHLTLSTRTTSSSSTFHAPIVSRASSLPVTPGTPPTPSQFPSDPFSHPTSLPEPTRSRPASLSRPNRAVDRSGATSKGPEIIVASPSTATIHYLFPSAPSLQGNHLRAAEALGLGAGVARSGSRRRKGSHQHNQHNHNHHHQHHHHPYSQHHKHQFTEHVSTVSAIGQNHSEAIGQGRTSRFASEPIAAIGGSAGIKDSRTLDGSSMRTLRRQPSMVDLGAKARGRDMRGKENIAPKLESVTGAKVLTLAGIVEEKKNKAALAKMNASVASPNGSAVVLSKSKISSPIIPAADPGRRRSMSLSSPRPAPAVPVDVNSIPAVSSEKLRGNDRFFNATGEDNALVELSASGAVPFINPFAFPGSVPMTRGDTKVGCGGALAGKEAAKLDAENRALTRLALPRGSITSSASPISSTSVVMPEPAKPVGSIATRVRRSLSLRSANEAKIARRRSQSVTARGEKRWDTEALLSPLPMPVPLTLPNSMVRELGLGDPGVDLGDKYAITRLFPSALALPPSSGMIGNGLGLHVTVGEEGDLGQRSPVRKRIDLGGSEESLLAPSTVTMTSTSTITTMTSGSGSSGTMRNRSRMVGLGFSPLDSPISLPESLIKEAVDLTERGRMIRTPTSGAGGSSKWEGSDIDNSLGHSRVVHVIRPRGGGHLEPSMTSAPSSAGSTPYLQSLSQMTTPQFPSAVTSPMPQTPHSALTRSPNIPNLYAGSGSGPQIVLGSPAQIQSPQFQQDQSDHTTKYAVGPRKPNLRYSKSFTSDVTQRLSRKMSWRGKVSGGPGNGQMEAATVEVDTTREAIKEKRLSRSFSMRLKNRSAVPVEIRHAPAQTTRSIRNLSNPDPISQSPRIPSNTADSHRWRTPTVYSLCSPDGAIDPLPYTSSAPSSRFLSPLIAVTAPTTPDLGTTPMLGSSLTASTSTRSPFLAASSSIRGLAKGLTKSISRTFDRHHTAANESVRSADSALKAKISSPLEATRELRLQQKSNGSRQRDDQSRSRIKERKERSNHTDDQEILAVPQAPKSQSVGREGSREWRESLLSQAVSHSIEEGLCDLASASASGTGTGTGRGESLYDPTSIGRTSEKTRTSWSRSVGRTFGLKESRSSGRVMSGMNGSFAQSKVGLVGFVEPARGLAEVGKQESNLSIYSTASLRPPTTTTSRQSPPSQSQVPTQIQIHRTHQNFSLPTPQSSYRPTAPVAGSTGTSRIPSRPYPTSTSSQIIYRPPTPPAADTPMIAPEVAHLPATAVLHRLSAMSAAQQAAAHGKDERVKQVLKWRRGVDVDGEGEGECLDAEGGDADDIISENESEIYGKEAGVDAGLQGMIARHVEGEKEVLQSIVRRKSRLIGKRI